MKKYIIVLVLLIIVIFGVYLSLSKKQPKTYQTVNIPVVQTKDNTSNVIVNIKNFAFNPQTIKIKTGTKITWINDDSMAHTVTSDTDNLLNSKTLSNGESFSFTFTKIGTTNYHCNIHKTMQGTVIVE